MTRPDDSKPFQFTLWQLAVATFWMCILLALAIQLGQLGVILAFLVGCSAVAYCAQWMRPATLFTVTVPLMIATTLWLTVLWPAISTPRWAMHRSSCRNNLSMIGIALHNYHDRYGSFPPAYIADDSGQPMHSWRVLLLPFLEEQALYDRYDFKEPWDGPKNIRLSADIVRLYSCPGEGGRTPTQANYVAVVGPDTAWPGEGAVKLEEIADGTGNTILIVEMHNSGIHWMEPRDLQLAEMPMVINPPREQGISSLHPRGVQVLFTDGTVRFLSNDLDSQALQGLLTIAGGEKVALP